jgi:hypothetical protein
MSFENIYDILKQFFFKFWFLLYEEFEYDLKMLLRIVNIFPYYFTIKLIILLLLL